MRILFVVFWLQFLVLASCEYGDVHGSAASSDIILGFKEKPTEVFSFRSGTNDFTGFFVSEFSEAAKTYFENPPSEFYQHPKALSYEKGHTFVHWRATPVETGHQFLRNRVESLLRNHQIDSKWAANTRKLLNDEDCFYAVSYEDYGSGRYDNITFYLLDPSSRQLTQITDTSSF